MKTLALSLALVLVAPPLDAQTKGKAKPAPAKAAAQPAPATPATVELVQVHDSRSSGRFSSLQVHVKLPGVLEKDVAAQRVVARKAVDDAGKDLVGESQQDARLTPTASAMGMGMGGPEAGEPPSGLPLTVTLASPSRSATAVKELTGEIELFMPSRDPASRATIEKVLGKAGKPLQSPALTANRVEITFLTRPQLDAEKKKLEEKKRQDSKKEGLSGEMLESILTSFVQMLVSPEEGELVAQVKDPDGRIQDFAYVTPSGDVHRVVAMERDGFTVLSSWGGKPQPDWALRIDLRSPKALVRHTFTLAEVPLP